MAEPRQSSKDPQVPSGFGKILNRHGYGLQYSILKVAEELYERQRSAWALEVAEFPVMVKGVGTRIDFILRHRSRNQLLIAECKRANPALANWCFVTAPFVRSGRASEDLFAELIYIAGNLSLQSGVKSLGYTSEAYHLAFEIKTGAEGDYDGSGRGAVEEAATQVCRGLNGLVEYYGTQQHTAHKQLPSNWEMVLSPVIFTTAKLWVSNVDLSLAAIGTGEIDPNSAELVSKPQLRSSWELRPLGEVLDVDYVRTIHIVNANSVSEWLKFASNTWRDS